MEATKEQIVNELKVDPKVGLTRIEAEKRIAEYGRNVFEEKKQKTKLQMFLSQLRDPMIYILMAAMAISAFLKEYGDAVIILAVVLLNAIIGVVQENKAEKALEALKKMSSPGALVRRDGEIHEVLAADLVPGDIVLLETGRIVPADLRLLSAINLRIEEAALTGESVPTEKDADFVPDRELSLGDRVHMAFQSTSVAYGRGEGIVMSTGMNTEIGKIAKLISETKDDITPLQKRLGDLGKILGILTVFLCTALFIVALLQGRDVIEMLLTAISLAVAAIPEGLPAVVTIVLALGVTRMVKVNTIVRKLPAVETLGAVTIVCTDKTGTLTQNIMTVTKVFFNGGIQEVEGTDYEKAPDFLKGFLLCTDATISGDKRFGDPTELALLDLAARFGLDKRNVEDKSPRINELPFDSSRKKMTTVHRDHDGSVVAYTKGAVDHILQDCTKIMTEDGIRSIEEADITAIKEAVREMASNALRVLGLAKKMEDTSAKEEDLIFVGMVGMIDPPRQEAAEAVRIFRGASVTTVMITGDHIDTAFAIAKELGIADSEKQCLTGEELNHMSQDELNAVVPELRVFARVSPENKVMIVNAFRSHGHIVSMTGDGVNDAPSLKTADIGVAMGITGTDVAKGAADMILTDDNFATIQKAIEEGRIIYNNIRKSVLFLLSSNLGEVLTMFVAILAGLASPLKAIHILWVNLITDSLPGLALGVDLGDPDIMKYPPRNPKESLFARGGGTITLLFGTVIGFITLAAFLYLPVTHLLNSGTPVTLEGVKLLYGDSELYVKAQTYAFTVLAISQLFNAIGLRNVKRSIFRMKHLDNPMMLFAFAFGFGLQIAVTEIPFLTEMFGVVALSLNEWLALTAAAAIPLVFHELLVLVNMMRVKRN